MSLANPNLKYYGTTGVIIRSYGTLLVSRSGLATCAAEFMVIRKNWTQLPQAGAQHPIFTFIQIEELEINFEGAYAVSKCKYVGADPRTFESEGWTPPTYELSISLSEERIATHPKFKEIGGSAKEPKNGANFRNAANPKMPNATTEEPANSNDGYVFDSFDLTIGDEVNDFAGMESYLDPGATWRATSTGRYSAATINAAGSIGIPIGPAPNLSSGRNWLSMGMSSVQRGRVFQLTQEWRASGRRGWNRKVYG